MSALSRAREALRGLLHPHREDAEMDEELRFHLEMEAERLAREEGLAPEEARRRAAIAFGGVERTREEVREARGLGWVSGLSLDLKLGLRMMRKSPGLALVGVVAMAVAIGIGVVFDVSVAIVNRPLPLPEGERIVTIENWDLEINNQDYRVLHDFVDWREELTTVRELGAYYSYTRNLLVPGRGVEPVRGAQMSASGFRLARVPPLLGRWLVEEGEQEGAPAVVVLAHDVWLARFGGDPEVVGRQVRLGDEMHTVVGVMPEGFHFPMSEHLWTPLRVDPADYGRREGPMLRTFGRLAPGATLESARAELATLGLRTAAAHPGTHELVRPRMVPYTEQLFDDGEAVLIPLFRFMITLLLAVICVNVAVLVYARTATREAEITVRSALGASRRRIVAQLFAEALVLAGVAAAAGVVAALLALRGLEAATARIGEMMGGLPYWIEFRVSPATIAWTLTLALLAAAIVGVLPALQATGPGLERRLRRVSGGSGMRMGRTWTVLIVAQVAFAVAALPAAIAWGWEYMRLGLVGPGFPAEEYLSAGLTMDRETPPSAEAEAYDRAFDARYRDRFGALLERLRAEPALSGVTFFAVTPGQDEPVVPVEVEGGAGAPPVAGRVQFNRVDLDFFRTFDLPILSGRELRPADLGPGGTAVIVSRSFAREILNDASPVGRRFRYAGGYRSGGVERLPDGTEPGRWYEVVGMVDDFPRNTMEPDEIATHVYHPLAEGEGYGVTLAMRTRGTTPARFVPRLREIAAAVDPTLEVVDAVPFDVALGRLQGAMRMGGLGLGLLTLSVLLLSAAGIYALMSFTVTRRRREIGIRSALGAHPAGILRSIFARAAAQLAVGAGLGLAIAVWLDLLSEGDMTGGQGGLMLLVVVATMLGVGLLATLGPARRGLAIQPMEALREE